MKKHQSIFHRAAGPGLDLIMYILTTLEFPKHNLDYYLYNMEHKNGKNVYCILDMVVMGIVPEECPVSVKNIILKYN